MKQTQRERQTNAKNKQRGGCRKKKRCSTGRTTEEVEKATKPRISTY